MSTFVRRTFAAAGAVAGAIVLSVSTLAAQGAVTPGIERPVSFGITGGATFPTGDFGDAAASGFNVGALLEFKPSPAPLSFRIEGEFQQFGLSDDFKDLIETLGGDPDVKFRIISGTANAVYKFPVASTTVRPYLIGGVGVYNLDLSDDETLGEEGDVESETKFGLNGGAGIELPLSGLTTFIEVRFHSIFTEDAKTNLIPVRVGIRF